MTIEFFDFSIQRYHSTHIQLLIPSIHSELSNILVIDLAYATSLTRN